MPVSPNKIEISTESWNDADRNLFNIICKTVKEDQKAVQKTARECKKLFKQKNSHANPREVLTQLGESLISQEEHYKYYTQHFLPALLGEIIQSKKLELEKIREILEITSDIIKQSSGEEYKYYIETFLPALESTTQKLEIKKIIMELKISDDLGKSRNSQTSNGSGLDSGIGSREPSEESLESSVSSRKTSVSSILSSIGRNDNLQKENENQMQPEQAVEKEPQVQESGSSGSQANPDQVKEESPQVSSQCLILGSREKESMDPNSQTTQMIGSQVKDSMQPEEKKDKKNAITTVQKLPVNEKKGEDISFKQPNNRNLHVALVAGCALSTIGCIVAGAMTSGLIGAGLLAMAAVFAIAAVAELHSNFLSSKLTSINVSPLVDGKQR